MFGVPGTKVFQAQIEDVIVNEVTVEIIDMNSHEVIKCSICNKIMKNKKTLKQHMKLKHVDGAEPEKIPKAPLNKKCFICNQYFTSNQFQQHMKEVHPGKSNKEECDLSDRIFPNVFNLKRHKESVHSQNKRFACVMCDYITQRGDLMREHMDTHADKKFQCKKCHKFKSNREREVIAHSLKCKPKPFPCDLCEVSSISLGALSQHKQVNFVS